MASHKNKMALLYIIAIFFISIDRFLKLFFSSSKETFTLINDYLTLHYVENYYIAFSLPVPPLLIKYLSLLIAITVVYFFVKHIKAKQYFFSFLLFILILGSFSNIYDRFVYGFVIDYIDLKYFAVFNIADSLIFISIILIIYELFSIDKNIKTNYNN